LVGCSYSSSPGVVRTSDDNPMVMVGGGEIEIGSGAHYYARYIIDTRTHVCWFFAGDSVAALDCCALYRVEDARPYLKWLAPGACEPKPTAAPPSEPAATPPAPAPPAPAPPEPANGPA
jgi:hypothetical protein